MDHSCHILNPCLSFPFAVPTWQNTKEQPWSFTSSIPWGRGLLSAARIPEALPDSCGSQSCFHLVYFPLSPEWSFCNESGCVGSLLEIPYGLLSFQDKNPNSLVWKTTFRDLTPCYQSLLFFFFHPHIICTRHINQLHFSECFIFFSCHWTYDVSFSRHAFLSFPRSSTTGPLKLPTVTSRKLLTFPFPIWIRCPFSMLS